MTDTPNEQPPRVRVAYEAAELLTGERQDDYGQPIDNFNRIARLWNAYKGDDYFTPRIIAELMVLLKMARSMHKSTEDTEKDKVGYTLLAAEFAEFERHADALLESDLNDLNDLRRRDI